MVSAISSASATSAFLMSSSAKGSRAIEEGAASASAGASLRFVMWRRSFELDLDRVPREEPGAPIRRHDRRAVEFLDQERSSYPVFIEIVARTDAGRHHACLGAEVNLAGLPCRFAV